MARERPILFSGPMVRAILDGRKTQTRRVLRQQPTTEPLPREEWSDRGPAPAGLFPFRRPAPDRAHYGFRCPYGAPGDRLWVRETFHLGKCPGDPDGAVATYAFDAPRVAPSVVKPGSRPDALELSREWRKTPAIHMPRWASRLTLEVTGVRVERLQDITEEDARAEGMLPAGADPSHYRPARDLFRALWNDLNEDRAPWASNPWVWVVEFRRVA